MHDNRTVILKGTEGQRLSASQETPVIQLVQAAYEAHRRGESSNQFYLEVP